MSKKFTVLFLILLLCSIWSPGYASYPPASASAPELEVETFGCEANPTGDPIGGGAGYRNILTGGDFTVNNADELLKALKQAKPGQVIFIPDGVDIDLSAYNNIKIPGGVTLAGTRGRGGSPGARLFTKRRKGKLFVSAGDEVRVTGLRFEGPSGDRKTFDTTAHFLMLNHYAAEVDNCEIYNFNRAGVSVSSGAMKTHVHHNFIHHCQKSGLGYGVSTNSSDIRIVANKFDYCRHHITSGGHPGSGYEAAWNLIGPHANGHPFDMHGGRDRGDGTDIAGDWMHIHHNTFQEKRYCHVVIRGVPSQGARIHHNWFTRPASKSISSRGNTQVYSNVYGPEKILEK
ncbi:MAG: hypothetical protein K8R91_06040 [Phycisphaerae bacterium]|nr:hypothetical protein [Phycisphaerae bacterium]